MPTKSTVSSKRTKKATKKSAPIQTKFKGLFSSASGDWQTPADVYQSLDQEFHFNLDPCPLGGQDDGLLPLFVRWDGKRVFCNPPYGPGIEEWIKRGTEAEVAVFLLAARTDTVWFSQLVMLHAEEIRFVTGRLRFRDAKKDAPFPSMIVVFRLGSAGPPRVSTVRVRALVVPLPPEDGGKNHGA